MTTVARTHTSKDQATSAQPGFLVVISAPSGGGKTSIIKAILKSNKSGFKYSISMTTRPPRQGERDGHDYFFVSDEEFQQRIRESGFVEWARVHNQYYGTLRAKLEELLAAGKPVIMDLDVQGGLNLKKIYGNRAILVFIKPPSMESLRARLCGRNTDSPADIDLRLESAKQEMAIAEQYDHIIINHHLEDTVKQVAAIVESYGRSPRS